MAEERCALTDLLVSQCGCNDHRDSPDPNSFDFGPWQISTMTEARYDGRCAIDQRHTVVVGDEIFLITPIGDGEPLGWVCEKCAGRVMTGG